MKGYPLFLAMIVIFMTHLVKADVQSANRYIDDATALVDKGTQFYDDASKKLDLADASLDDVTATDKPALQARIAALKAKMSTALATQEKPIIERKIKQALDDAEQSIGNLVTWNGAASRFNELISDPKTKTALGDQAIADYQKQFATFARVNVTKALQVNLPLAQEAVTQLEKDWADAQKKLAEPGISDQQRGSILTDAQHDIDSTERAFQPLPADNSDVKALRDRMAKVVAARQLAIGDAGVMEVVDRINRFQELYKDEFAGMDNETAVGWSAFKGGGSASGYFGVQKTYNYVSRVGDLVKQIESGSDYDSMKSNPKLKPVMDQLKSKVAASRQKISKAATAAVTQMEQEKINTSNKGSAESMRDTIRLTLGEESDEAKPLLARVDKSIGDFDKATTGAEAATEQFYKDMTTKAAAAWPAMESKFTVVSGFDPANAGALKGKLIKITTDNLMGYRFMPGDFPFATTINGLPVAGKYDPAVKSAITEIESKLHRQLGDNDDDGKWTVIARVEGTTGRLIQKVNREGDLKVDGQKVGTVTGTAETPVDAPIVTILAAHVGPLATAAGMAPIAPSAPPAAAPGNTASPSAAAPAMGTPMAALPAAAPANASKRSSRSFIALLSALLAIVVGAACLMKAGFAPIASNAAAADITTKLGNQNIAYLGLAGIAGGVIGLLSSLAALIHAPFMGLISTIACAALIVAGFTTSRGLLEQHGIVKPELSSKFTAFSIPAGLASAGLGVLMLLLWLIG